MSAKLDWPRRWPIGAPYKGCKNAIARRLVDFLPVGFTSIWSRKRRIAFNSARKLQYSTENVYVADRYAADYRQPQPKQEELQCR